MTDYKRLPVHCVSPVRMESESAYYYHDGRKVRRLTDEELMDSTVQHFGRACDHLRRTGVAGVDLMHTMEKLAKAYARHPEAEAACRAYEALHMSDTALEMAGLAAPERRFRLGPRLRAARRFAWLALVELADDVACAWYAWRSRAGRTYGSGPGA